MRRSKKRKRSLSRSKFEVKEVLELLSNTADGMFATDADGKILLWNRSAQEILGFQTEEVVGKRCHELLSAQDPAGNLFCFKGCSVLTMARRHQLVRNYNTEMMTKTKRKVWLNTSILLVSGRGWGGSLIVHLFRPISPPHWTGGQLLPIIPARPDAPKSGKQAPRTNQAIPPLDRSPLTRRETEVLTLLGQGLGAKEIADQLSISPETARTHIQKILKKLQVHSKLEAVVLALRLGLLQG